MDIIDRAEVREAHVEQGRSQSLWCNNYSTIVLMVSLYKLQAMFSHQM